MNNVGWVLRFKPVCVWVWGKKKRRGLWLYSPHGCSFRGNCGGNVTSFFHFPKSTVMNRYTRSRLRSRILKSHQRFSRNYGSFKPHGWTAGGEVTGLFGFVGLKIKFKKKSVMSLFKTNSVQRKAVMMRHFAGLARFWLNVQQSLYFMKKET